MRLRHLALILALCWMALLFFLSHKPSLPTPELFPHQDKLIHAAAYGVLAILFLLAMPVSRNGYTSRQVLISVLLASLYGISDEFHQSFVPQRSSDPLDWLADTVGALIAAWLVARLSRQYFAKSSQATL